MTGAEAPTPIPQTPVRKGVRGRPRRRRRIRRDRALCLRRFGYGESSLIVHVVTPGHGRRALLAKGAYRLKSRFFGVLDLFDELEIVWHEGASGGLGQVSEARIVKRRRGISRDLGRYHAGLAVLEIARLVGLEGQGEPRVFAVTETFLDTLDAGRVQPDVALAAHDLALLTAVGLAPALESCAACGTAKALPRGRSVPFSAGAGGRLCRACADEARASGRRVGLLPLNVLRVATSLLRTPPANLERVRLDAGLTGDVNRFVRHFLEFHLETRLRRRRPAPRQG